MAAVERNQRNTASGEMVCAMFLGTLVSTAITFLVLGIISACALAGCSLGSKWPLGLHIFFLIEGVGSIGVLAGLAISVYQKGCSTLISDLAAPNKNAAPIPRQKDVNHALEHAIWGCW